MMVWFFRRIFMAFFGLLFGVVALPIHPDVLWTHTRSYVTEQHQHAVVGREKEFVQRALSLLRGAMRIVPQITVKS